MGNRPGGKLALDRKDGTPAPHLEEVWGCCCATLGQGKIFLLTLSNIPNVFGSVQLVSAIGCLGKGVVDPA